MKDLTLAVIVDGDSQVVVRRWDNDARCKGGAVNPLEGLDGRLLRLFESWLTLRDRSWTEEEIRVFGQLLHGSLFTSTAWAWIEEQRGPSGRRLRLELSFETDEASSRLAALPWEYLCSPDRHGQDGRFVALDPGFLLSRSLPPGTARPAVAPDDEVRILPVVGEADDLRLGRVEFEDVVAEIARTKERPGFKPLDPLTDATESSLSTAVLEQRPHVVHYLGHGRFRDGRGAILLKDDGHGTPWLDESRLARAICSETWKPSVVVLHACEGGATDYEYRFAGLAPAIVRAGVSCVVAMQYAVRNSTAVLFSTALYDALAAGSDVDEAVLAARDALWKTGDPRLVGIPMVYRGSAEPLLSSKAGKR